MRAMMSPFSPAQSTGDGAAQVGSGRAACSQFAASSAPLATRAPRLLSTLGAGASVLRASQRTPTARGARADVLAERLLCGKVLAVATERLIAMEVAIFSQRRVEREE